MTWVGISQFKRAPYLAISIQPKPCFSSLMLDLSARPVKSFSGFGLGRTPEPAAFRFQEHSG